VACYRGSEDDVLARVTGAIQRIGTDVVVQMTADNPLYCPEVIDAQISMFLAGGYDYVGDNVEPTYPVGCGAKIFRAELLAELNRWCEDPAVREHVSLYFYEHPERYRVGTLRAPPDLQWPDLRVTVDEPDDLAFARAVYERLQVYGENLTYPRLVSIVRETGLNRINQHVCQRPARGRQTAATPRR
jgi:spore coat polysaccharide biosynthesis protein SpsF